MQMNSLLLDVTVHHILKGVKVFKGVYSAHACSVAQSYLTL